MQKFIEVYKTKFHFDKILCSTPAQKLNSVKNFYTRKFHAQKFSKIEYIHSLKLYFPSIVQLRENALVPPLIMISWKCCLRNQTSREKIHPARTKLKGQKLMWWLCTQVCVEPLCSSPGTSWGCSQFLCSAVLCLCCTLIPFRFALVWPKERQRRESKKSSIKWDVEQLYQQPESLCFLYWDTDDCRMTWITVAQINHHSFS